MRVSSGHLEARQEESKVQQGQDLVAPIRVKDSCAASIQPLYKSQEDF